MSIKPPLPRTTLDRVDLKRANLFFGHGLENIMSIFAGASLLGLVFYDANVPFDHLALWFNFIFVFSIIVLIVEHLFKRIILTVESITFWMLSRTIPGVLICLCYGITPYLFGSYLSIQHEMFLFIMMSAIISVACAGYTLYPIYYSSLCAVTLLPLTVYFFLSNPTPIHNIMTITAILWQIIVLSKAWRVSRSAINEIYLNVSLQDEVESHKQTRELLAHLATHDALTNLPNRRLLKDRLDSIIKRAHRQPEQAAILFIDLDGFKQVNDSYGHESGDRVLQEMSQRILSITRETDTLARVGGDEFVLIYTDVIDTQKDVTVLSKRILDIVRKPFPLSTNTNIQLSASIGIAVFPTNATESNELLKAADIAMYKAKEGGKNNFVFSSEKGSN